MSGIEVVHLPLRDARISYFPRLFDRGEARVLFERLLAGGQIEWRQQSIALFGRRVRLPRLTAWYGDEGIAYRYSGLRMEALPWRPPLDAIRARVQAASGEAFNSVLLNLYRDGNDCVSWHSDDERELGRDPVIASVSLGATRDFQLRHKRWRSEQVPRETLELGSGSLLVMGGPTQRHWQHRIPRRSSGSPGARVNLTFRRILTDCVSSDVATKYRP